MEAVCHVPDGVWAICDESKIRQVLDNLLENALQSLAQAPKRSDAARQLGINRKLLYEKLQQLGIG